jgi:predicted ATPase
MRIAISGTHFSGKSTLVEELSRRLPKYSTVEEPYYLLEEDGYEFSEMPSVEDFELQLERSLECVSESEPDVIFDRCPADILGYLLTHSDAEEFDLDSWLSRCQAAVEKLDLIVFLPIEERDRIALPSFQDADFRAYVDEKLKEILLEDSLDLGVEVLTVTGALAERVEQIMEYLQIEATDV